MANGIKQLRVSSPAPPAFGAAPRSPPGRRCQRHVALAWPVRRWRPLYGNTLCRCSIEEATSKVHCIALDVPRPTFTRSATERQPADRTGKASGTPSAPPFASATLPTTRSSPVRHCHPPRWRLPSPITIRSRWFWFSYCTWGVGLGQPGPPGFALIPNFSAWAKSASALALSPFCQYE